ncbi:hypothetical protein PoB_001133800 [Plakobranchus ocellatus]|uniref:Uncharacterized protein n=1 Tax=Plakobranchus ocellatus TaxID=259542 RepID=A0AAV3YRC5_9GAST|nr:hypothetical protein PoB_001133800 [Plakobranchus ocellatus]
MLHNFAVERAAQQDIFPFHNDAEQQDHPSPPAVMGNDRARMVAGEQLTTAKFSLKGLKEATMNDLVKKYAEKASLTNDPRQTEPLYIPRHSEKQH